MNDTDYMTLRDALVSARPRYATDIAALDRVEARLHERTTALRDIEVMAFGGRPSQERLDIIYERAIAALAEQHNERESTWQTPSKH